MAWNAIADLTGPPGVDGSDADVTAHEAATDPHSQYATDDALATGLSGKANTSHSHGAADVSSGVLNIARVPTGTSGTTVALGNHNHSSLYQPLDSDLTAIAALAPSDGAFLKRVSSAWAASTLSKSDVGLGSVDNTADTAKPVSTAQQTALNLKQDTSARGAANGYVPLDASAGVPRSYIYGATNAADGILRLAGDLGGTAASPTVPGLAGKANTSHTHIAADLPKSLYTTTAVTPASGATYTPTADGSGGPLGYSFTLSNGNMTLALPTGSPTSFQIIRIAVGADGAARTFTFGSGYNLTNGIASRTISISTNKQMLAAVEYTPYGSWLITGVAVMT